MWKTAGAAEGGRVTTTMLIYSRLHLQYEVCRSWGWDMWWDEVSEHERILLVWVTDGAAGWSQSELGVHTWQSHQHGDSASAFIKYLLHNSGIIFLRDREATLLFLETIPYPRRILNTYVHLSSVFWRNGHISFPRRPFKVYVTGSTSECFYRRNAKAGDWVR